jgi:DNA processing protein
MKNEIKKIAFNIKEFQDLKKYPKELFYIGNTNLLNKTKISIVGSRTPNQYAQNTIAKISSKLSQANICLVSGGALGIDTIVHNSTNLSNTIMVAGTGLDKRYPSINRKMIETIEDNGLVISQFKQGVPSNRWNFPIRNELIVALGKILIVAYADIKSGTMRSVEYALKMGKEIYVLPHHIEESEGTNQLLKKGLATAIYDINEFVEQFSQIQTKDGRIDKFLEYCQLSPTYDDAISKFGAKVFEYELGGKIEIRNGMIMPSLQY